MAPPWGPGARVLRIFAAPGLFCISAAGKSRLTVTKKNPGQSTRPSRAIRRSCSLPVGNGAPEQNAEIYTEPEADSDGAAIVVVFLGQNFAQRQAMTLIRALAA